MPAIVDDPTDLALIAAGDFGVLVPPGASSANASVLVTPEDPIDQIALTWLDEEPSGRRTGLVVWQRFADPPIWRAVYAFTDPPRKGVFGIRVDAGDVTGDRTSDLLSFEDVGGSGACGTYRVIATTAGDASEIFRQDTCDTEIAISRVTSGARSGLPARRPHCCPSAFPAPRFCGGTALRGRRPPPRSCPRTRPDAERRRPARPRSPPGLPRVGRTGELVRRRGLT
jgi:hypothetical protein